jgi:hypothetical protein
MNKRVVVVAGVTAAFSLVATVAFASHNVDIKLGDAPLNSDLTVNIDAEPVEVLAIADGTNDGGAAPARKVSLHICDTWDDELGEEGEYTGVYQESAACENEENETGARWREVKEAAAPLGEVSQAEYTFSETGTLGTVGFRAEYRPGNHSEPEEETTSTRVADLHIEAATAAEKHAACNGLEVAYQKVAAKSNEKGKGAQVLERVVAESGFNCDLGE